MRMHVVRSTSQSFGFAFSPPLISDARPPHNPAHVPPPPSAPARLRARYLVRRFGAQALRCSWSGSCVSSRHPEAESREARASRGVHQCTVSVLA